MPMNFVKPKSISFSSRIFVIGDIHGCARELDAMLLSLQKSRSLSEDDTIIFLGDYIDRGPESFEVVELLLDFKKSFPKTLFLKGNHEDMLLAFLGLEGNNPSAYLSNGGYETLLSYGIDVKSDKSNKLSEAFSKEHLDFYQNLDELLYSDHFIFVHAGLNPLRTIEKQTLDDVCWIRQKFLKNIHPFEKVVFYGHTPTPKVNFDLPYRVGVDTALVFGSRLSCIELTEHEIFEVKKGSRKVSSKSMPKKAIEYFNALKAKDILARSKAK